MHYENAEVVVLNFDNFDIVTISDGSVTGTTPLSEMTAQQILALTNINSENTADRVKLEADILAALGQDSLTVDEINAIADAVHQGCANAWIDVLNAENYTNDEEDESFDSEW